MTYLNVISYLIPAARFVTLSTLTKPQPSLSLSTSPNNSLTLGLTSLITRTSRTYDLPNPDHTTKVGQYLATYLAAERNEFHLYIELPMHSSTFLWSNQPPHYLP